jgi:hypothetical protein
MSNPASRTSWRVASALNMLKYMSTPQPFRHGPRLVEVFDAQQQQAVRPEPGAEAFQETAVLVSGNMVEGVQGMIASKCPAGKVTASASEQANSASGTFRVACWICSGKYRPQSRGIASQGPRPPECRSRSPGRERPRRAAVPLSALLSTQRAARGRCRAPARDTWPQPGRSQPARSRSGHRPWPSLSRVGPD